jgi:hypothetical protein
MTVTYDRTRVSREAAEVMSRMDPWEWDDTFGPCPRCGTVRHWNDGDGDCSYCRGQEVADEDDSD